MDIHSTHNKRPLAHVLLTYVRMHSTCLPYAVSLPCSEAQDDYVHTSHCAFSVCTYVWQQCARREKQLRQCVFVCNVGGRGKGGSTH